MIEFEADLPAAFAKAKSLKRPIMIAVLLRGEPANEDICAEHLEDPAIIEFSKRFVCLLSFGRISLEEGAQNSAAFLAKHQGRLTKDQLAAIEKMVRVEILETSEVTAPQFLFFAPDGKLSLLRHVWMLPKEELLAKMQLAYHFFDPTYAVPSPPAAEKAKEADGESPGAAFRSLDLDALLVLCDDNNMVKRRDAMTQLASREHPKVIEFLSRQVKPGVDTQRRLEAIRSMGKKSQVKFLPSLHGLLKESDFQIRSNVANALSEIGLIESVPHLIKVLQSERKDNIRSLLIRALHSCGPNSAEVQNTLKTLMEKGTDVDRMTILWLAASVEENSPLIPWILKPLKSANDKVRAFAYYAAGRHKLAEALTELKKRENGERQVAQKACSWAIKRISGQECSDETSPSSELSMLLPVAAY